MKNCKVCKNPTMLMAGTVYLTPDAEPYESGVEEESKEGITDIEVYVSATYCETCDKVTDIIKE